MLDPTIVTYAFGAGLVAALNPCGFAVLPAYVSYFLSTDESGSSSSPIGGVTTWERVVIRLRRALTVGVAVSAGFVLLFGAAGAVISAGVHALADLMPLLGLLVGAGLALVGAWLLAGRHIPGLRVVLPRSDHTKGLWSMFLFGLAYGLASLSCALPVFLVAVAGALVQQGFGAALAGFGAYTAGMMVVLLAITVSLALFQGALVAYAQRALPYVHRISGLLVLGAGAYIVHYWLDSGFIGGLPW